MTTFKIIQHIEVFEGYQGFNLTGFKFQADVSITEVQIVDIFLYSDSFKYDSLLNAIKREPYKSYLGRAFDIDKITSSDFKQMDKKGATKFLMDFLNEADWGDDRIDFSNLLNKYLQIHSALQEDTFFVISKNWFDLKDERLLEPQSWCYTYYFLIIYLNKTDNNLLLTEWMYD